MLTTMRKSSEESQIWSILLESMLAVNKIEEIKIYSKLVCSPHSIIIDIEGKVSFQILENFEDFYFDSFTNFFPPELETIEITTKDTFEKACSYGIGGTLYCAADYKVAEDEEPVLSVDLEKLLEAMTSEDPLERPTVQAVSKLAEEKAPNSRVLLSELYQEVCNMDHVINISKKTEKNKAPFKSPSEKPCTVQETQDRDTLMEAIRTGTYLKPTNVVVFEKQPVVASQFICGGSANPSETVDSNSKNKPLSIPENSNANPEQRSQRSLNLSRKENRSELVPKSHFDLFNVELSRNETSFSSSCCSLTSNGSILSAKCSSVNLPKPAARVDNSGNSTERLRLQEVVHICKVLREASVSDLKFEASAVYKKIVERKLCWICKAVKFSLFSAKFKLCFLCGGCVCYNCCLTRAVLEEREKIVCIACNNDVLLKPIW